LDEENKDFLNEIFGFQENGNGCQSNLIFYDVEPFDKNYNISIRDGIQIGTKDNEYLYKNAQKMGKYNYEIIDSGAKFQFRLEANLWRNQQKKLSKLENLLFMVLSILKNGELQFGAKTTRGFGKIKLEDVKILKLNLSDKNDVEKWINLNWETFEGNTKLNELNAEKLNIKDINLVTLYVSFRIPYSLLIGEYFSDPGEVDIVHIQENGASIIPGTSWNGALRSAIYQIFRDIKRELLKDGNLKDIIEDKTYNKVFNDLIESLFGFVAIDTEQSANQSRKSRIYIEHSKINNRKVLMKYIHNKIDRFTGGAVDGALFTDCASYGGSTDLHIIIKDCKNYEVGMILLGIKELMNGFQSIGGTTAVGRGILESKEISINHKKLTEAKFEDYCNKFINEIIRRLKSNGKNNNMRDQNE